MDFGVHKKYWVGPIQSSRLAPERVCFYRPTAAFFPSRPARRGTERPRAGVLPETGRCRATFEKSKRKANFGVASSSSLESEGAGVASWAKALIPEARIIAAVVWYFFKVKSDFLAALLNPRGIMECLAIVFLGCAVSVFRVSGQPPWQAGRKATIRRSDSLDTGCVFLRFPSPVYRTFERYLGSPCPTFLAGKILTPRIDTSKARPYCHTSKYVNVWD